MTLDLVLLRNFAIALFLGALVGLDRERKAANEPYFGGLRTYVLIALAGAAALWLGALVAVPWLFAVGLLGLAALLSVAYATTNAADRQTGLTGEVAALVVYLLGAACTAGFPEIAVVLGVVTAGLLAFKDLLHRLAAQVGPDDLTAGLKLLFATFVVLPLLPDAPLDPYGALNPARLWSLVILISALSLGGYVAVRWLGGHAGMVLTGLFGGVASSTAMTMTAARSSREPGASPDALAMSVLLAWAVMFARVVTEIAVVRPSLLTVAAPPLVVMAALSGGAAAWFGTRPHLARAAPTLEVRNPFSLWEAGKFALLFAGVLLVVAIVREHVGPRAMYAVAALAGTTDVDAITLSLADLAGSELTAEVASLGIIIASSSNTLVKAGLTGVAGARPFSLRVAAASLLIVAGGLVTVLVR